MANAKSSGKRDKKHEKGREKIAREGEKRLCVIKTKMRGEC